MENYLYNYETLYNDGQQNTISEAKKYLSDFSLMIKIFVFIKSLQLTLNISSEYHKIIYYKPVN